MTSFLHKYNPIVIFILTLFVGALAFFMKEDRATLMAATFENKATANTALIKAAANEAEIRTIGKDIEIMIRNQEELNRTQKEILKALR
jgi:hypothetical protein